MPNLHTQASTQRSQFAKRLAEIYLTFKENLLILGYADEIEWQQTRRLQDVSESDFMTEASWVIISTGLSNFVVERVFPKISEAYHWWTSASKVAKNTQICEKRSLPIFRNPICLFQTRSVLFSFEWSPHCPSTVVSSSAVPPLSRGGLEGGSVSLAWRSLRLGGSTMNVTI